MRLTCRSGVVDDEKRILTFSDAGGTGRSYHADKNAKNAHRRVHYLLEPGWRADNAIQGLGRSNRTNQSCAPLFRPVATDVKGEKRFLSTIARRLDTDGMTEDEMARSTWQEAMLPGFETAWETELITLCGGLDIGAIAARRTGGCGSD